jgi:hypothetical protein
LIFRSLPLVGISLASSDALFFTGSLAFEAFPSSLRDIVLGEALCTAPVLLTDISLGKPYLLFCLPLLSRVFVLRQLLSFGTAYVFLMEISEVVSIVIFPGERVLGSRTFDIVAGELVFLVGVYIFIVPFEVSWSTKDILLPSALSRKHAGILILFVAPKQM